MASQCNLSSLFRPRGIIMAAAVVPSLRLRGSSVVPSVVLPSRSTATAAYPAYPAPSPPPRIKLSYFDFGGRMLPARLALTIAGIPFEDERISDFDAISGDTKRFPTQSLPTMTLMAPTPASPSGVEATSQDVPSRVYCQSHAIVEYCGDRAGMGPASAEDALAIRQALMTMEDLFSGLHGFHSTMYVDDVEVKKARRLLFVKENLTPNLRRLEQLLEESHQTAQYHPTNEVKQQQQPVTFFGSRLSVADLWAYQIHAHFTGGFVDHVPITAFDAHARLTAVIQHVHAMPAVRAFMTAHPYG